jgi:hypothetical protein
LGGRSTPATRAIFYFSLSLSLFMFGIRADHPHHALAVDDFALVAHLLY